MESRMSQVLGCKYQPVAVMWTEEKPAGATQFQPGKWGCVMAAFGATVERGKPAAFDRQTYGCWGGGVGLGFGNVYHTFPGGIEGFYRFLSDGNAKDPKGQAVADACATWMRGELREDFLHGEGYRKNPQVVEQMVNDLPITDIPSRYVIFKPLKDVSDGETPQVVVFLADADQMSALVVLANYGRAGNENAIIPFAAGCQTAFLYAYHEAQRPNPRAVVGLNDLSARKYLRKLGKDLVTVSLPYALYQEMENNVTGSFLEKHIWQALRNEAGHH